MAKGTPYLFQLMRADTMGAEGRTNSASLKRHGIGHTTPHISQWIGPVWSALFASLLLTRHQTGATPMPRSHHLCFSCLVCVHTLP